MFETEHTPKRRFRYGAVCRTIKALGILKCSYGSESKCETPTTNISQEIGHGILMIECQNLIHHI